MSHAVAILAGGLATRLRPITEKIPKALVDVNGEPFVLHQLRLLAASGVERVVLCVGHLGEMVRERLGEAPVAGQRVAYAFDGPRLLGTAGALRRGLPLLGPAFGVLYGDSWLELDYRDVFRAFEASGAPALMTVFRNEGRWDTSNTVFEGGRILKYDKKDRTPAMRHIDYGFGVVRASVLEALPAEEAVDLADVYRDLAARGQLAGYEAPHRFYEIGSPAGLEETRAHLARRAR
ncbi:MAG TPA: nucleotidyltransferase family protein [Planctomycetota bacterium]|nr:nucleotidyltransferase family protein [Planctomycetota bacterium]